MAGLRGPRRSWALALVAAGCAGQPNWTELPPPPVAGAIKGRVTDHNRMPLPDHIVAIGGEKTTTDGGGWFSFPQIPAGYDLIVASPDRARATVYQELTRRDPVVTHGRGREGGRKRAYAHQAQIDVTVSGGEPAPKTSWHVAFAAPGASGDLLVRGFSPDGSGVVRPGTLDVAWDGADTISGVVLALLMKEHGPNHDLSPWFAKQPITLRAGGTAQVTIVLAKVPTVMRPPGKVTLPPTAPPFPLEYHEHFSLPGAGRVLHSAHASQWKPFAVPDLRAFGLELCAEAFQWNPYLRSSWSQCGYAPDKQAVIELPPAPAISSPAWGTTAAIGLRFSWAPVPNAVYRLLLADTANQPTRADRPTIEIFTARATATWPDLSGVGIVFPRPPAGYGATVGARGPFASLDQLVAPPDASAKGTRERWSSDSQELSVPVQAPLGPEEAACQKLRLGTITCGEAAPGADVDRELYVLPAINKKLRTFPDFANAVNIHCVRDCAEARAFTKAYKEYSQANPGFDDHQPLGPLPPPPPPPPAMLEEMRRRR
jgi:hypothetical protein